MVVKIRLKRTGRRNRACFRLNAIEGRNPRDGRVLENLGYYDPLAPRVEDQLRLKVDRVQHWLAQGARLSETAAALCSRQGVELPQPKERKKRNRRKSAAKVQAKQRRFHDLHKAKQARAHERSAAKKGKTQAEAAQGASGS